MVNTYPGEDPAPLQRAQPFDNLQSRSLFAAAVVVGLVAGATFLLGAIIGRAAVISPGVVWATLLVAARPLLDLALRRTFGERAPLLTSLTWASLLPWVALSTAVASIEPPLVASGAAAGALSAVAWGAPRICVAALVVGGYAAAAFLTVLSVVVAGRDLGRGVRGLLAGSVAVVLVLSIAGAVRSLEAAAPSEYAQQLARESRPAHVDLGEASRVVVTATQGPIAHAVTAPVSGTPLEVRRTCAPSGCLLAVAYAGEGSLPIARAASTASNAVALPYVGRLSIVADDANALWILRSDDRPVAAYRFGSLALTDVTVGGVAGSLGPEPAWLGAALAGLLVVAIELIRRRRLARLEQMAVAGKEAIAGPGGWLTLADGGAALRAPSSIADAWAPGTRVLLLGERAAEGYRGGRDVSAVLVRGGRRAFEATLRHRRSGHEAAALASLVVLAAPLVAAALAGLVF